MHHDRYGLRLTTASDRAAAEAANLISDRLHRRPSRRDLAWSQEVARQ
ncbi:hypothetical protein MTX26_04735 [Bradyrhizobium sp. ISRA443]|nr:MULTISPECIES: hypothetical protein [unclassified Bradyrhizobium]WGR95226.1 hypothetical protein MTX20_14875 [Bradyrhizobium sp. ISRA435]WGS00166.1 hypothetical protein MTX23_04735 [Bradyrhizobium sp. ISRA436]WGS07055.1 hypothetical protein MTX18_04735 [Bradyrhizobium sp. ISRA437]WGS13938.1 hypothetical protein MTX26_04735 [Bradyrhizobium sp. ISRA443]